MASKTRYRQSNHLRWVTLAAFLAWSLYRASVIQHQVVSQNADFEDVQVVRVIDGDTLLIEGSRRVRLLGVDTPETKHPRLPPQPFGAEATEFTKRLVETKTVRLIFDVERFDDYERILAFVEIGGLSLNEELVLAGLATAETQYPFRSEMKKRLIAAEKIAQEQGIGIWSLEPSQQRNH